MKLLSTWFALSLVSSPGLGICPDRLQSALQSHWSEPSARLGVVVRSGGKVLVDINGNQAFIPASLQKLFTTAGALRLLGPEFRVRTILTMAEQGQLTVRGGGDPSFNSHRDLPQLVSQLKRGHVPVQNIQIETEPWGNSYGAGWEWEDIQAPYGAPIGGIVIDENILEWQVSPGFNWKHPQRVMGWQVQNEIKLGQTKQGQNDTWQIHVQNKTLILRGTIPAPIEYATPLPDPGEQFLALLQQELKRQGVQGLMPGEVVFFSPLLQDLVKITNKDSHNLYSEQLLRILGRQYPLPGQDYETRGRAILTHQFQSIGFYLADGSGLSRHNQATPRQIVEVLVSMEQDAPFRASLPIAGKDGTLIHRLKHLNVQAKTGTLTGISTLAGYLTPAHHPPVVFAILINHSLQSPGELRDRIDAMVEQINRLTSCDQSPRQF